MQQQVERLVLRLAEQAVAGEAQHGAGEIGGSLRATREPVRVLQRPTERRLRRRAIARARAGLAEAEQETAALDKLTTISKTLSRKVPATA